MLHSIMETRTTTLDDAVMQYQAGDSLETAARRCGLDRHRLARDRRHRGLCVVRDQAQILWPIVVPGARLMALAQTDDHAAMALQWQWQWQWHYPRRCHFLRSRLGQRDDCVIRRSAARTVVP